MTVYYNKRARFAPRANRSDSDWLKIIANNGGLIVTFVNNKPRFTTGNLEIPEITARRLIERRWLVGDDRDALIYGTLAQRYSVLKPGGAP